MKALQRLAAQRAALADRHALEAEQLRAETAKAIEEARGEGLTADQIAQALGISRQRVYQLR